MWYKVESWIWVLLGFFWMWCFISGCEVRIVVGDINGFVVEVWWLLGFSGMNSLMGLNSVMIGAVGVDL